MIVIKVRMYDGEEYTNGCEICDNSYDSSITITDMRILFDNVLGGLGYILKMKDREESD